MKNDELGTLAKKTERGLVAYLVGCIEKIESEGFKKALCGKVVGP